MCGWVGGGGLFGRLSEGAPVVGEYICGHVESYL